MHLPKHIRIRRPGFTLVELLIVIAIIAVLVGLLSAAVMRALGLGNQTTNMADIRRMTAAVQAFQTHYKVTHIPSRIRLCKYLAHYDLQNTSRPDYQLNKDSHAFLTQMWPRLEWTKVVNNQQVYVRIDWDSTTLGGPDLAQNPPAPSKANVFDLDGGQCLVFFLGGIPLPVGSPTAGTQGFSTNHLNPVVGTERVSPFYEFKSNRLTPVEGFYHYLDSYGTRPYAYFSSYGKRNGYNRYRSIPLPNGPSGAGPPYSDCHALGVFPYAEALAVAAVPGSSSRYLNPDTFQIISAGANEKFGRGTYDIRSLWNLKEAGERTPEVYWDWFPPLPAPAPNRDEKAGEDDQSNFHSSQLGVAGQ